LFLVVNAVTFYASDDDGKTSRGVVSQLDFSKIVKPVLDFPKQSPTSWVGGSSDSSVSRASSASSASRASSDEKENNNAMSGIIQYVDLSHEVVVKVGAEEVRMLHRVEEDVGVEGPECRVHCPRMDNECDDEDLPSNHSLVENQNNQEGNQNTDSPDLASHSGAENSQSKNCTVEVAQMSDATSVAQNYLVVANNGRQAADFDHVDLTDEKSCCERFSNCLSWLFCCGRE